MKTKGKLFIKEGLDCQAHGKITAIDCGCLRDSDCKGCIIFDSLSEEKNENTHPPRQT